MTWVAVVPVKDAERAKTRLSGVGMPGRRWLAEAFALDLVEALDAATSVATIVVVTSDPRLPASLASEKLRRLADTGGGLNAAIRAGATAARRAHPGARLVALPADLPAATPTALETCLARAAAHPRCVLADAEGIGSTVLTARSGATLDPRFGPSSLQDHLAGGAHLLSGDGLEPLRRDVDLAEHLRTAVTLGVGRHTRGVLERLSQLSAAEV